MEHVGVDVLCFLRIAKRRTAKAEVKLWIDGTGKVSVNKLLLIEYFPRLQDRYVEFWVVMALW